MGQYLIATITKSHVSQGYIKGPCYNLDLAAVQKIVSFLKSKNRWTYKFLHQSDAIIEKTDLFEKLCILDPYVNEDGFQYSFDLGDIKNYFAPGLPPFNEGYKHLAIIARDKENGMKYFTRFLDKDYQDLYLEKFNDPLHLSGSVSLQKGDVAQISADQYVNYLFDFNFSKYNHVLEFEDPWNYIIKPGEEWMVLQEDSV